METELTRLEQLALHDASGSPLYHVAASPDGDLVLCSPAMGLDEGLRALDAAERTRLAGLSTDRPALVVESHRGDYVVLLDRPVDLDRYVPLGPADAEVLARTPARARFGHRDDDVVGLTPWADEDDVVLFDPEADEFADVPLVSISDAGELVWHRGTVEEGMMPVVRLELRRSDSDPETRFGVLTNEFGECACSPEGTAILPHEDLRRQAVMGTDWLLDGVQTLPAAAARLRLIADRLESAAEGGWQLVHPVTDGVVFAEFPI